MVPAFISIRIVDIIDIVVVAFIMYQVYYLIKGTVAFNIFLAVLSLYLIYRIVQISNMKMLTDFLGAIIGGGAIALIIVFQQEIRRFLIFLGTRYFPNRSFSLESFFSKRGHPVRQVKIDSVYKACVNLSKTKTGALIVISKSSSLQLYSETGDILNANTSSRLIESIFMKDSPLHDGAIIIEKDLIIAARCVLPFTNNTLPPEYGMRHRAGLGICENTDAFVVIISEERGQISVAENNNLVFNVGEKELYYILQKRFR